MKKPLGLKLDEHLVERIDRVRGDVSRTRFIERAIERALEGDDPTGEVERGLAELDRGDRLYSFEEVFDDPPDDAAKVYHCPMPNCRYSAPSPAAVCSIHGRRLK